MNAISVNSFQIDKERFLRNTKYLIKVFPNLCTKIIISFNSKNCMATIIYQTSS